jgi:hypothetical protein
MKWLQRHNSSVYESGSTPSWGGLVWIVLGEIFPLRVRGTAMGMATAANWIGNLMVGQFFPTMLGLGTGLVFLTFSGFCLVACGFAYLKVPETKGRTLEQLEEELALTSTPATEQVVAPPAKGNT